MKAALIIAHRPTREGRPISVQGDAIGHVHSDADLVKLLQQLGLIDPQQFLDDPEWIRWEGGHAHCYDLPRASHEFA
ncbi:hypothetical protein [Streptomyces sp. N35]|uniref:hypothetical protein n=1 Tax=Streptomyces sp. N35 TaxID=2795730 RepID=UPI0018F28B50|nr:hypothetical protein [Streptomyces sp. N35]